MEKTRTSWELVEQFITNVAELCKDKNFDGVYGLPRGGLVFATMLSHRLNLPLLLAPTKNTLIVDDICDSGESLIHFIKNTSNPSVGKGNQFVCTMYSAESQTDIVPDYFFLKSEGKWIVFPWEVE